MRGAAVKAFSIGFVMMLMVLIAITGIVVLSIQIGDVLGVSRDDGNITLGMIGAGAVILLAMMVAAAVMS